MNESFYFSTKIKQLKESFCTIKLERECITIASRDRLNTLMPGMFELDERKSDLQQLNSEITVRKSLLECS